MMYLWLMDFLMVHLVEMEMRIVIGEGVVVSSYSLVKSINTFLGGMMVSLIFLEGLEEETWWKPWKWKKNEEDDGEDDEENSGCGYLTRMSVINKVKHENKEEKFQEWFSKTQKDSWA
ncbi:hypothetical protein Tco_0593719 [Tanacetum coccineum]